MQLKTFTGSDNKEVMDQIKAELGPDAVILDSRTHTRNGRKVVSMTAALEREEQGPTPGAAAASSFAAPAGKEKISSGPRAWHEEWADIKGSILALLKPALPLQSLGPRQKVALEYLEREGADDQTLLQLYELMKSSPDKPVLETLGTLLPLRPWGFEHWPQRVHIIAGPYGSGKTSVAVRMALSLLKSSVGQQKNARICIVNADADRGGGRLLLRHYTGLSDLIYREVSNAMDMAGVLAEIGRQGLDRVIVDMPSVPKGHTLQETASDFGLTRLDNIQTALHLVLSPHYGSTMLGALLERYHLNMPSSIVWSKLDEAERYGQMLNAAVRSCLPVSCLSYGPGLLNTLSPVEAQSLWRLIFKHEIPMMNTAFSGFGDNYE